MKKTLRNIIGGVAITLAGISGLAGCAQGKNYFEQTPNPKVELGFHTDNKGNLVEVGYVNKASGKVLESYWVDKGGIPTRFQKEYKALKKSYQ